MINTNLKNNKVWRRFFAFDEENFKPKFFHQLFDYFIQILVIPVVIICEFSAFNLYSLLVKPREKLFNIDNFTFNFSFLVDWYVLIYSIIANSVVHAVLLLRSTVMQHPLFNFIFFSIFSLFYVGYFLDDAELMLFFSCCLVIFFIGSYVNNILDVILEEYSNAIVIALFEKFCIQLELTLFEKEMYERLKILDEFLLYSVVFIEQQLAEHAALQKQLFLYHYSKIVEQNLISDAEEVLTKEHIEALISLSELEKYTLAALSLEVLVDQDFSLKFLF